MKRRALVGVLVTACVGAAALVVVSCELLVPAKISCDAGICAPDVPDGWSGPVVVYVSSSQDLSAAACPPGLQATDGFHDLLWDAGSCSFTCDPPTSPVCTVNLTFLMTSSCSVDGGNSVACAQPVALNTSACAPVNDCDGSANGSLVTTDITQGTCDATHLHPVLDAASPVWSGAVRICGGSEPVGVCSGAGCIAQPPAGFHASACVFATDATDCPPPYSTVLVHAVLGDGGYVDGRGCNAGSAVCGAAQGATCSGTVTYNLNSTANCNLVTSFAGATCLDAGRMYHATVAPVLDGGACATSGSTEASGAVTPTGTSVLVCCAD